MAGRTGRAQEEVYRDAFGLFDKNEDGTVNVQDLGSLIRSVGYNPTSRELSEIISQNVRGKSTVSYNEFKSLVSKIPYQKDDEAEIRESFRVFDRDGDGFVNAKELEHVLISMGEHLSQEEVQDIMREVEVNQDGKINYEEIVSLFLDNSAQRK